MAQHAPEGRQAHPEVGRVQLKLSDGTDYEGEVRDGSPNGVGVCKFPNGDRYEGFWEAGQPHGHGTLFYQAEPFKGDRHEGNFSSGVPNGHGVYFFSNGSAIGDVFEGMYAAGVPNGLGEYRYANGDRFEGTYVDGKRHGEGIASFKEAGHTFEGWFDQSKQTGFGYYFFTPAREGDLQDRRGVPRYEGEFKDGQFHGKGRFFYKNRDVYDGAFRRGSPHGHGMYSFYSEPNYGDVYLGNFRRGQYHGSGEYKSRNGTFFAGCWVGGKRHGPGQVRYATGKTMLQIYENGKLMSEEVEMGEGPGDFDVDAE